MTHAIIVAAGAGKRAGGTLKKQFASIAGEIVLIQTLAVFQASVFIDTIVCVIAKCDQAHFEDLIKRHPISKIKGVVEGGSSRQDSTAAGLFFLERHYHQTDFVVIHDGARPFVTTKLIERVIKAASLSCGAIAAMPMTDTLKQVSPRGEIMRSLSRDEIWGAQTPQVFPLGLLSDAIRNAKAECFVGTDEAALFERMGYPVLCVEGEIDNIKITTASDFNRAEKIARERLI
ncbi:MAG: 2-C-methyl-D-erythritol 4-phosphate cytidylyltransferase [Nitrospirota bacterium]